MDAVDQAVKDSNRKLTERFPFLIPRNAFSGRRITDGAGFWPGSPDEEPEYDYEYTELDLMPDGWRKAFGEQMCQEIMDELMEHGLVDDYYIVQIKEKYGRLCWYDSFGTDKLYNEIIPKYERLSERTCITCGEPATRITMGWVSPYCDKCYEKIKKYEPHYIAVDEYLGGDWISFRYS